MGDEKLLTHQGAGFMIKDNLSGSLTPETIVQLNKHMIYLGQKKDHLLLTRSRLQDDVTLSNRRACDGESGPRVLKRCIVLKVASWMIALMSDSATVPS